MSNDADFLDRTVRFLAKREGIDKTLKLIRYTTRLLAATTPPGSALSQRFSALEKSIGVSRKAYRLGKFLQDVNALRRSRSQGLPWLLEAVAYSGEGIYYFIEQLVWLIKAGALPKDMEARLSYTSAWAELLGYAADISLSLMKLQLLMAQERQLMEQLAARSAKASAAASSSSSSSSCTAGAAEPAATAASAGQAAAGAAVPAPPAPSSVISSSSTAAAGPAAKPAPAASGSAAVLERELQAVRRQIGMRTAAVVQDLADSLLAMSDIRGSKDSWMAHPVTLALSGLVSGAVSFHKNWTST